MSKPESVSKNFIQLQIESDLAADSSLEVVTRFPPEPNGYLHLGHAKAICVDFSMARQYGGRCHLRFDDTNPTTEDTEYVEAIQADVRWLGFEWDGLYFASDFFEQMYALAEGLIEDGLAYVDSQDMDRIRATRGTVSEPGTPSPYRDRSPAESLDLFRRMRAGEFPDGAHVLRGKGDMSSPNMKMRDPLLYRIRHAHHHRTGDRWCIYPMYDYAHPLEDALEGVTHSLCTLEFENNRDIYDWVIDSVRLEQKPRQYEFARLAVTSVITSKRKLIQLVQEGHVSGWDDPRMPTLAGLRRRGVTPQAIRTFCERVGLAKANSLVDYALFESVQRKKFEDSTPRAMAALDPVKVTLRSWPEGEVRRLEAPAHPQRPEETRSLELGRELWIDREDFHEDPPKGYRRLALGREVRLRYGCVIRCEEVIRDEAGRVQELICTHDPESWGGKTSDGRKVRGIIHWVSCARGLPAEVRVFDRLFAVDEPGKGGVDFLTQLYPDSLRVYPQARVEPSVLRDPPETRYQFERQGYFWRDPEDSSEESLVFNRILSLRDSWKPPGRPKRAPSRSASTPVTPQDSARRFTEAELSAMAPLEAAGVSRGEAAVLAEDSLRRSLYEEARSTSASPKGIANWVVHELPGALKRAELEAPACSGEPLGQLVELVEAKKISSSVGRELLAELVRAPGDPRAWVEERGLLQIQDDEALLPLIQAAIEQNPAQLQRYRDGNDRMIGFFIGQVLKASGGKASAPRVKELLQSALRGEE